MCQLTDSGFLMNDGTLIPFETNFRNISPEHISEMSANSLSSRDGFIMLQNLQEVKETVQGLENSFNEVRQVVKIHAECPMNPEGIKAIIRSEIANEPKKRYEQVKTIFKDVVFWITTAVVILSAYKVFGG